MKMTLNQIGGLKIAKSTVCVFLAVFSTAGVVAPQIPDSKPVIVTLPPGVTSAEIQQALDLLPESGGEVVLPAGTFEVRQPIVLQRDHQTLRGSGNATVLRLADGANCPVIILGEPVNNPQATVKDLHVSDLFIDGNRRHQQRELWRLRGEGSEIRNNGITVQSVSDSMVEHVTCARCRSGGLVTTLGVRRLTVRDLTAFDNEFDGLACYQTEDCLFTDFTSTTIPAPAFRSTWLSITTSSAMPFWPPTTWASSCARAATINFTTFPSATAAITVYSWRMPRRPTENGWQPVPQTECAHNAFTNLIASHCGDAAFRVNDTTCTNNVIVQPQFQDNVQGGLSLAQPDLVVVQ